MLRSRLCLHGDDAYAVWAKYGCRAALETFPAFCVLVDSTSFTSTVQYFLSCPAADEDIPSPINTVTTAISPARPNKRRKEMSKKRSMLWWYAGQAQTATVGRAHEVSAPHTAHWAHKTLCPPTSVPCLCLDDPSPQMRLPASPPSQPVPALHFSRLVRVPIGRLFLPRLLVL